MTNKIILEEVYGTITEIYDYPVFDCNGRRLRTGKGIIIQPDNPEEAVIYETGGGIDYSQFKVGQRVVLVSYTWKRPATDEDRKLYFYYGMECPDEVDDFDYVTYDEKTYGQKRQPLKRKIKC